MHICFFGFNVDVLNFGVVVVEIYGAIGELDWSVALVALTWSLWVWDFSNAFALFVWNVACFTFCTEWVNLGTANFTMRECALTKTSRP